MSLILVIQDHTVQLPPCLQFETVLFHWEQCLSFVLHSVCLCKVQVGYFVKCS